MKIKGNMKKATAFTPELFPPPTPENFAKYSKFTGGSAPATTTTTTTTTTTAAAAPSSGLKAEKIFGLMGAYMTSGEGKSLVPKI
jgi:hypothetical protein